MCQFGSANASFVSPRVFRELRAVNRHPGKLLRQRSSMTNCVYKLLERHGVQLDGILANLLEVNNHRLLDGLISGDSRKTKLASPTGHAVPELNTLGDAHAVSLTPIDQSCCGVWSSNITRWEIGSHGSIKISRTVLRLGGIGWNCCRRSPELMFLTRGN